VLSREQLSSQTLGEHGLREVWRNAARRSRDRGQGLDWVLKAKAPHLRRGFAQCTAGSLRWWLTDSSVPAGRTVVHHRAACALAAGRLRKVNDMLSIIAVAPIDTARSRQDAPSGRPAGH
jgi:hypothetical protein